MYGISVPQNLHSSLIKATYSGGLIMLMNTVLQTDGYLRGIEVYAATSGTIMIGVKIYIFLFELHNYFV
jgi:hypothetical protein